MSSNVANTKPQLLIYIYLAYLSFILLCNRQRGEEEGKSACVCVCWNLLHKIKKKSQWCLWYHMREIIYFSNNSKGGQFIWLASFHAPSFNNTLLLFFQFFGSPSNLTNYNLVFCIVFIGEGTLNKWSLLIFLTALCCTIK